MDNTNATSELITPVQTTFDARVGEISLLARALRAESFGALTQREAIDLARLILAGSAQRKAA